jgi:hypothetical protein
MSMRETKAVYRMLLALLLALANVPSARAADARPGLVKTPEGQWRPASGYTWVAPEDPRNLDVRVRPGLRIFDTDAAGNPRFVPVPGYTWDGDPQKTDLRIKLRPDLQIAKTGPDDIGVSFRPAPGYVWDGEPNNLVTRVRGDLRIHHYFADGSASFVPAPAYMWVGEPNDFVTRLRPHLRVSQTDANGDASGWKPEWGYRWAYPDDADNFQTELKPGIVPNGRGGFSLAAGYAWLKPEDQDDLSVMPAPGYTWASTNPRDLRVMPGDRGESHAGTGGTSEANRSPAMNPELKKDLTALGVAAGRVGAGAVIGGAAGKLISGSPVGVIVGGLLSSSPTAGPEVDMTHQPGEPHGNGGGNGGNGGNGGGGNSGGGGSGGGHSEPHHEGAGSFK